MMPLLVDQVRAAGLPVSFELDTLPELSAGLDLAAFRIVQEALTNALKHSAAATTVSVRHTAGQLAIDVRNDGPHGRCEEHPATDLSAWVSGSSSTAAPWTQARSPPAGTPSLHTCPLEAETEPALP